MTRERAQQLLQIAAEIGEPDYLPCAYTRPNTLWLRPHGDGVNESEFMEILELWARPTAEAEGLSFMDVVRQIAESAE